MIDYKEKNWQVLFEQMDKVTSVLLSQTQVPMNILLEELKEDAQYENFSNYLSYCFVKINELSYEFLENGTVPNPEFQMLGMAVSFVAHKMNLWKGDKESVFSAYADYGVNNITKETALRILKEQNAIKLFAEELYNQWSKVHKRGIYNPVFTKGSPWG